MPELPDVVVYVEALEARVLNLPLERVTITSPFVLHSVDPPLAEFIGHKIQTVRRLGKQIVLAFEGDRYLVIHLMIAGRLQWKAPRSPLPPGKLCLATFEFSAGTLVLTEAGSKKRASIYAVRGQEGLDEFDRHALEALDCDPASFTATLTRENHTLKRALTDPRLFSGIGNAYSDEILHRAGLSPLKLTSKVSSDEARRLWESTRGVLTEWTDRLRNQTGKEFPSKVTAFRPEMAVHGRYRKPCPVCGSPVQRIAYAENECNYCAQCQTGGRLLADRAMSRFLKEDWPRSLDELEKHFDARRESS